MPHIEPEHVGGAWLVTELLKAAPAILRRIRGQPKKLAPGTRPVAVELAELRGEMHEFKRAVLVELEVQRNRYHGVRALVATLIGINAERRAAREEGREFDTGVFEVDIEKMMKKLDAIPEAELPALSPPVARPAPPFSPPLPSPKPGDDEE